VVGYVLSPLRGQYLAIMEVLEQSVDHLTPAEVRGALVAEGTELSLATVTGLLRALSDTFLAASGRPDSEVERWYELNGAAGVTARRL
jgi:Fe2+ or Zn2+ uptake regulation protein